MRTSVDWPHAPQTRPPAGHAAVADELGGAGAQGRRRVVRPPHAWLIDQGLSLPGLFATDQPRAGAHRELARREVAAER